MLNHTFNRYVNEYNRIKNNGLEDKYLELPPIPANVHSLNLNIERNDFYTSLRNIIQDVKDGIEFAKLTDFAVGAKSISVKNAVLDFRGATLSVLRNLNLSLDGVIIIELDDLSGLVDNLLLYFVRHITFHRAHTRY